MIASLVINCSGCDGSTASAGADEATHAASCLYPALGLEYLQGFKGPPGAHKIARFCLHSPGKILPMQRAIGPLARPASRSDGRH
jgi:hypothetical protein